jgi:chromosome segregation protein
MANIDGLDIQFVQNQWEESQKLISDLRVRLASLVSSSESASASMASIQAAEASIGKLAESSDKVLDTLKVALEQALSSLQSIQGVAAQSDLGAIATRLDSISLKQNELSEIPKRLVAQDSAIKQLDDRSSVILEGINKLSLGNEQLRKKVEELDSRIMKSEEEQSKLIQKVKAAVSTLPTRHQGKFANLTG